MKSLMTIILTIVSLSGIAEQAPEKKTERNIEITLNNLSSLKSTLIYILDPSVLLSEEIASDPAKLRPFQCSQIGESVAYSFAAKNSLGYYNLGNLSLQQEINLGQIVGIINLLSGIRDIYCVGESLEFEDSINTVLNELEVIIEDLNKI